MTLIHLAYVFSSSLQQCVQRTVMNFEFLNLYTFSVKLSRRLAEWQDLFQLGCGLALRDKYILNFRCWTSPQKILLIYFITQIQAQHRHERRKKIHWGCQCIRGYKRTILHCDDAFSNSPLEWNGAFGTLVVRLHHCQDVNLWDFYWITIFKYGKHFYYWYWWYCSIF